MKLRKLICGLMAALLLAMAGGSVLAAETYQETILPLAKNLKDDYGPLAWVFPDEKGGVDYFLIKRAKQKSGAAPEWFHSADGGRTWQEKDMSWHSAIREQAMQAIVQENQKWTEEKSDAEISFEKAGKVEDIFMAETGTPYFLIQTADRWQSLGIEEGKKSYTTYDEFGIYKLKDGKAQRIPNITIGEPISQKQPFQMYKILRAEENGKLTILSEKRSIGSSDTKMCFLHFDEKTGKLLSKSPEISGGTGIYRAMCKAAGNLAYVLQNEDQGVHLAAYDMDAGEKVLSVPCPPRKAKSSIYTEDLGISPDGTIYLTNSGGLYRFDPGTKSFTTLMSGTGTRMDSEGWFLGKLGCADNGNIYTILYTTQKTGSVVDKLLCYSLK